MASRSSAWVAVALLFIAAAVCVARTSAQMASGTVSSVSLYDPGNGQPLGTCPGAFWSPSPPATQSVCYGAKMTCSNQTTTPTLGFIYSYVTPPTLSGTVVLFPGGQGEQPDTNRLNAFAQAYYYANFEVVQIAWPSDWEQTTDQLGILTAACRPAGFLNYVLNTPLLNARTVNPAYGLCAHGFSAGSGALGYSLTWYGDSAQPPHYLSADLDNVELTSGPVFSDIEQGCHSNGPGFSPSVLQICYPGQQYGCSVGTTGWGNSPAYIATDLRWVQAWTGNLTPACNANQNTSASDPKWKAMSILTGTGGNFTYPNLGMAGWLCASSIPATCGSECPNNSAAQGDLFFSQFTSSAQVLGFKLTGIAQCVDAEGVGPGQDPDNCTVGVNCPSGESAIVGHMKQYCSHAQ